MQTALSTKQVQVGTSTLMTKCSNCSQDVYVATIRDHLAICNERNSSELVPHRSNITDIKFMESSSTCSRIDLDDSSSTSNLSFEKVRQTRNQVKSSHANNWMIQVKPLFPERYEADLSCAIERSESFEEVVNNVPDTPKYSTKNLLNMLQSLSQRGVCNQKH